MRIDHNYAREKLTLLLRDLDRFNGDEFWREMSRIATGATESPSAEDLLKERDALAAHVERLRGLVKDAWKDGFDAENSNDIGFSDAVTIANSEEGEHIVSLSRRDLIKQAQGLEVLYNDIQRQSTGGMIRQGILLDRAIELREEAEDLESQQ